MCVLYHVNYFDMVNDMDIWNVIMFLHSHPLQQTTPKYSDGDEMKKLEELSTELRFVY
jgi:hypothetical protein